MAGFDFTITIFQSRAYIFELTESATIYNIDINFYFYLLYFLDACKSS